MCINNSSKTKKRKTSTHMSTVKKKKEVFSYIKIKKNSESPFLQLKT